MSIRLVPKSVTLNDLEWRNGRYFALFQRIRVASGRTAEKLTFAISSPDEFLLAIVSDIVFKSIPAKTVVIYEQYIYLDWSQLYFQV